MSTSLPVDFGRTARDYARYRTGFPASFFDRLTGFGIGMRGQRILDLGTGTGAFARPLAQRGAEVMGVDPAEALLAEAGRMDAEAGVQVRYRAAGAESTGLPAASFDAITAAQCWHWFDRTRAAAEAFRLLAPGGAIAIAYFDRLPLPGNVVEATEALIVRHQPGWKFGSTTGIYPEGLTDLAVAGFVELETFSYDVLVEYSHEAWRGRIRASSGVAASLPAQAVATLDRELTELLATRFAAEPLRVPHRAFAIVGRKPRDVPGIGR